MLTNNIYSFQVVLHGAKSHLILFIKTYTVIIIIIIIIVATLVVLLNITVDNFVILGT